VIPIDIDTQISICNKLINNYTNEMKRTTNKESKNLIKLELSREEDMLEKFKSDYPEKFI